MTMYKILLFEETEGRHKWHICQPDLEQELESELNSRGSIRRKPKPHEANMIERDHWFWDIGGIMKQGRQEFMVEFLDFKIKVPAIDFKHFIDIVEDTKQRSFQSGVKYYKLVGTHSCLVIDEEHYNALKTKIMEIQEDILKIGVIEEKEMFESIEKLNNVVGNIKVPFPN